MNQVKLLSSLLILSVFSLPDNARAHLDGEGIIGGEDAEFGEYTYQVSLTRKTMNFCGGSIIGKQHIVTAAHCVTNDFGGLMKEPIKIIAGVNDLKDKESETRVEIDVDIVYIPKEYDPLTKSRTLGDIAILKLLQPLDLDTNPNLSKLQLGDPSKSYANETAIITGFGYNVIDFQWNDEKKLMEEIGGKSFDKMRFAEAYVLSNNICLEKVSSSKPVGKGHLCAQIVQRQNSKLEGVCAGDSGGPLVHGRDTLIGIVSTSPSGCHERIRPAVYTRVSEYRDFIHKAMDNIMDPQIRFRYLKIDGIEASK